MAKTISVRDVGCRSIRAKALSRRKRSLAGGRGDKSGDESGCRIRRVCVCGFRGGFIPEVSERQAPTRRRLLHLIAVQPLFLTVRCIVLWLTNVSWYTPACYPRSAALLPCQSHPPPRDVQTISFQQLPHSFNKSVFMLLLFSIRCALFAS